MLLILLHSALSWDRAKITMDGRVKIVPLAPKRAENATRISQSIFVISAQLALESIF